MGLFREIRGFAYNIVLALKNLYDVGGAIASHVKLDMISNGYRVGASDAFEAKVTLYPAVYNATVYGADTIDAT